MEWHGVGSNDKYEQGTGDAGTCDARQRRYRILTLEHKGAVVYATADSSGWEAFDW